MRLLPLGVLAVIVGLALVGSPYFAGNINSYGAFFAPAQTGVGGEKQNDTISGATNGIDNSSSYALKTDRFGLMDSLGIPPSSPYGAFIGPLLVALIGFAIAASAYFALKRTQLKAKLIKVFG